MKTMVIVDIRNIISRFLIYIFRSLVKVSMNYKKGKCRNSMKINLVERRIRDAMKTG